MSTQFKPGNEFIYQGKKYICLEPKRTRMTAIDMETLHLASFPMIESLEKTEGSWKNLIAAIEDALSNLKPGTNLKLESKEFAVKAVLRNGDIEAVSKDSISVLISKWSPWWIHFVPPECVPSSEDQPILYNLANLRSLKRKDEAYSQLKKQGFEVVPYLLLNMGTSLETIKNASVRLVGGEGKLNLGLVKFPSTIDQHAFKLSSQIIADIAVEGYLKMTLEMIENIDEEIRSQIVDDISHLKRCRSYTKESLEKSIDGSLFSAGVVFRILAKKRGKESVDMLEKAAKHGRNQKHRSSALGYLKNINSNQARKAVAQIEGKSVSHSVVSTS